MSSSFGGMGGGLPPEIRSSPPPPAGRRSRSRSPPSRSGRRHRSSPASRSPSPPTRRRRSSRSRSPRSSGGGHRRGRSRSWSRSRSRSHSPRSRSRPHRDDYRDRGPPMRRGPPPPGFRGDYGRYDHVPPYGGDPYGHPRGPPPPYGDFPPYGGPPGPFGPPPPFHHPHHPPMGGPPPSQRRGGGRRRDEGAPGVSLLIRNVSPDITPQDLQIAFGRIGEVRDVYIPRDFHSQQPKGFAFIEYATAEMAREAREEMDRFIIRGRELEVVYAQEKRKSPNEMRSRVVNPQNREPEFERSSSFERHKQKSRDGPKRSGEEPSEERRERGPRSED